MTARAKAFLISSLLFITCLFFLKSIFASQDKKSDKIVARIIISLPKSIKGPIEYRHCQFDNPSRIFIEFISKNVFSDIDKQVQGAAGIINDVQATFYSAKEKDKPP